MEEYRQVPEQGKPLVAVRAYRGDAMTLLAFDLSTTLKKNLAGFTITFSYTKDNKLESHDIYNRITFSEAFLKKNNVPAGRKNSTMFAPIQRFSWVHVPSAEITTNEVFFGDYIYSVTPRYIVGGKLQLADPKLTVQIPINVSPYDIDGTKIGFARGFVSSVAYVKRFGFDNNKVRPADKKLLFDIKLNSGTAQRYDALKKVNVDVDYTFEEQHSWLGWQARARILEYLDEAINDNSISVKAFAYDLDEPEVCRRLLKLAESGRLSIIIDDAGKHGATTSMESQFEKEFKKVGKSKLLYRGHFSALAHKKVFIQIKDDVPVKVLAGSTNFSTNGIYINANHVLIFTESSVAKLFADVFDNAFGKQKMGSFKSSIYASQDSNFALTGAPQMTVTFAPHPKVFADKLFTQISDRIDAAESDVLFAIMQDTNKSAILDSVMKAVKKNKIFTYGVTDTISKNADYEVFVYKPQSTNGIRVAAKGIQNVLPPPLGAVPGIVGYAIHHKFIVVDFKGADPIVYCGSSNLTYGPEQKNGDCLFEIRDKHIVTAFAIEAIRLVDHYHWRNKEIKQKKIVLDELEGEIKKQWSYPWYDSKDLRCRQRELYIS